MALLISEPPSLKLPKMDFSDDIKNIYNITLYTLDTPIYNFKLSNYSVFLNMPEFYNVTF